MRWLKFNAVGALGMAVQLAALAFLLHVARMHYLLATALAVEAAVMHNFVWHCRWTWADRRKAFAGSLAVVFMRFNLTTGTVSIAGNVVFMSVLVGRANVDPVIANLLAIALCSLANFALSDRWTFASAWHVHAAAKPGRNPASSPGT